MAATISYLERSFVGNAEYGTLYVSIPAADVLNLGTAIELIAAPGTNRAIEVLSAKAALQTTNPYATNTTLQLITDTAVKPQMTCVGALLSASIAWDWRKFLVSESPLSTDTQIIWDNKSLKLIVSGGNPTTGTSLLVVIVRYKISGYA